MKLAEIEALAEGLAPVIRAIMADAIKPLIDEDAELRKQIIELRAIDHAAAIEKAVGVAVAAIPPAAPGRDGTDGAPGRDGADGNSIDLAEVERMVASAVASLPPPKNGNDGVDGKSVDMEEVRGIVAEMVAKAVQLIPVPKDGRDGADGARGKDGLPGQAGEPGKDVDPETIRQMVADAVAGLPPAPAGKDADPGETAALVRAEVEKAVAALPKPQDGRSVTVEELVPVIEERLPAIISEAVARIPVPKDGKDGAPGILPIAKAWTDGVTYEAEVRTHNGATWQAVRDTGREPGDGEDWICLAAAGASGKDADEIEVRGTFDAAATYRRLNIVALNGAAFMARKDDPGACPGEGWQMIAMQGKRGPQGEVQRGTPGPKGEPGPAVKSIEVDDMGMLVLTNTDGSVATCDLYPLLSKIGG